MGRLEKIPVFIHGNKEERAQLANNKNANSVNVGASLAASKRLRVLFLISFMSESPEMLY